MAVFLVDGGYFVKRFQIHWHPAKGKNMHWWREQSQQNNCTQNEMKDNLERILNNDLSYLEFRMGEMAEIERVFVCYDGIFGRRPRGNLYKGYKRNRKEINPRKHKGRDVRDKIQNCGLEPMALREGWHGLYNHYKEADDLLAEMSHLLLMCGKEVVIMTGDSDMYQLLAMEGSVRIHDFTKEIDEAHVIDKCGIPSYKYADWKALVGDSSDGIPGIKGIGKSTAAKLLNEFECIEDIPIERFDSAEVYETALLWRRLIKLPLT